MRTTLNLPDALVAEMKARAASTGRTMTSLVEEALRMLLSTPADTSPRITLPTHGVPGGKVLVDLEDRDALWDVLDERR